MSSSSVSWLDMCGLSDGQQGLWWSVLDHRFSLYSGIAGTGKTTALVAVAAGLNFLYGQRGIPLNGVLASMDMNRVKERFIEPIERLLVSKGLGEVVGGTKMGGEAFRFFDKRFGTIKFLSLHDWTKIKGRNIPYMGIDELTEVPEQAFEWIDSRVRLSHPENPLSRAGHPTRNCQPVFATTNPDGESAEYVEQYFIKKSFDTDLGRNRVKMSEEYNNIVALPEHNPDEAFMAGQMELSEGWSEEKRRAWAKGEWGYSEKYRFQFEPLTYNHDISQKSHTLVLGVDYGYDDDTAVVFVGFDKDVAAWVDDLLLFNETDTVKAAQRIAEHVEKRYPGWRFYTYIDPHEFNKDGKAQFSLPSNLARHGIVNAPSTNDLKARGVTLDSWLGSGKVRFHATRAERVYKELLRLKWGKKNPNDLVPHSDIYPALFYALNGRYAHTSPNTPEEHANEVHWQKFKRAQRKMIRSHPNCIG